MDVATPASSGGTESSSAPLTFQQAFAADASPASSTPTPDSTTPPAAAQPGEGAGTPPAEKREPFIPRDRFDEVNTQLGELKTWKEQYGWAAQIPQADLQEAIRIAQLSKADPIAYVQSYISELQSHPTYGAQLKSLAARALAQRSQAPAAASPDLTPISVQLDNGQTVPLYSADQIAALKSQWLAEAEAKFQPVTQTVEQLQAARAAETEQVQSQTFAAQVYTQVKQWPGVDDAAMKAMAEVVARDTTLPAKADVCGTGTGRPPRVPVGGPPDAVPEGRSQAAGFPQNQSRRQYLGESGEHGDGEPGAGAVVLRPGPALEVTE
jgi:hypothetical protein